MVLRAGEIYLGYIWLYGHHEVPESKSDVAVWSKKCQIRLWGHCVGLSPVFVQDVGFQIL